MNNIVNLTLEHLVIVSTTILFSVLIAVPLSIVVYKKNLAPNTFISVVSLFQAFPTIALFALLVPFLGIGLYTAIFAMIFYAIMPIFINTLQAFKMINPEYYDIVDSLNISKRSILFKIEVPLVLPSIINGVRLATIYTISLATMATLIGAGGLGDLIYLGLQTLDIKITITGLIPLMILTIIANIGFNYLEKKLLPADQKYKLGLEIR